MHIRILSATDVRTALPMPKAIEAMRLAFGQLSAGQADMPLRSRVHTDAGVSLIMPAYLKQTETLAVKVVSVYNGNLARGLPNVLGAVMVLDPHTGAPLALMDGASLTAIRTGAGGGLAAQLLAREAARTVALFGASVQARAQLQAVMAVRDITHVYVVSLTPTATQALAAEVTAWPHPPIVVPDVPVSKAVREADIVITATSSETPVFDGNDLQPGAHVTAIGAHSATTRELDEVVMRRASRIVVDSREAAGAEAGDLLLAQITAHAELGEIVNGTQPGRTSPEEITVFKSVGLAVQDAAAAAAVLAEAEARGLGTVVEL